jgi:hypothetical protein
MTTAYTGIPNGDIDQDSPVTQELITALRDDPIAIAEGAIGAPVTAAGWHPYNSTLNGTGDGKFYDFAVHGAVASIETPAFADGYEYMIILDGLTRTGGGSSDFQIELYRETTAAYSSAFALLVATSRASGIIELPLVRKTLPLHIITSTISQVTSTTPIATASAGWATFAHASSQKISKARLSFTGFNTSAGKLYLYRRSLQ